MEINSSSYFSLENATRMAPKIKRIPIIVPVRFTLSNPNVKNGLGMPEQIVNIFRSSDSNLKSLNIFNKPKIEDGIKIIHPNLLNLLDKRNLVSITDHLLV
ncbi:MAG: hypothetical protein EPN88_14250 [Bacteroidetes bacterium]|nr:MAG: hypothetical protein EPN88_14250 [Bacteroidota bacterium]